ncbi:flagellar hook-basal body complex protein [Aquibacillus koreensis]|uniref:Flagellar hook protein FlgE n=1 Tax=Aquibacillus koreensis TaxID=279446 RepID=A0A9X3WNJ2_9BACI|nr:flagellar hook-basal body complex protein [Aquibacillus koreensis]MCT2534528.1 flagellar hook-basal body complex protein [Aquibacillus koreensis]MDC3421878.1 flagellar hook-basal body complex protein [Aquibacillus koreensis]
MLRSMYAGISGMRNFQTKLDVVGNNIANVNTAGFKKGRITFQDMMSQTSAGAQGPTDVRGGINPKQVGTGSQMGTIDTIHTQGNRQTTNRTLDLSLEGDGMFVLGRDLQYDQINNVDAIDVANSPLSYTRSGNFYLDSDGFIVDANGSFLLGNADVEDQNGDYAGTLDSVLGRIKIPENAQSFSIQGNGLVTYVDAAGQVRQAGQILLAKFSNPGGLEKTGSNTYQETDNSGLMTNNIDAQGQVPGGANPNANSARDTMYDFIVPESEGTATIVSGALEMSNVDLSEEFTEMITAQRGFQANTRIITTSDEILQELVNLKR